MLKFRRRRRTTVESTGVRSDDLGVRNLLDDPRLRSLVGEIDPSIRPVALDWSRPLRRPTSRRRQLLRAA